jgi:hypothetical protein
MSDAPTPFLRAQENGNRRTGVLNAAGRAELSGRLVRTEEDREFCHFTLWTAAGWTTVLHDGELTGLAAVTAIAGGHREKDSWATAIGELNRILGDGDTLPIAVQEGQFDTALRMPENGNRRTGVLDACERLQLSGKLMPLPDDEREVAQIKLWTPAGWTEYLFDPKFTGVASLLSVTGGGREKDAWKPAAAEHQRLITAGY